MKKKIFIVIIVLLVVGLGGYLVYDKVIDKDVDKKEENKTEENYDLTKANNLLKSYEIFTTGTSHLDLSNPNIHYDESIQKVVAFHNVKAAQLSTEDCKNLSEENQKNCIGVVNYEILNEVYEIMFDKTLEKKSFESNCEQYAYLAETNQFVVGAGKGCGSSVEFYINKIKSAKIKNNELVIILNYGKVTLVDNGYKLATQNGLIDINIDDLDKDENSISGLKNDGDLEKLVLNKYLNKFTKYKIVFKEKNGEFIFKSINKIN